MSADQYYLFTVPGDELVWAETYLGDGTHVVAPTPRTRTHDALVLLKQLQPGATIDFLDDPRDLAEVREWAHTMPLEQIGASK
jgi:hypothetical protein